MSQWEQLKQLDTVLWRKVDDLYTRDELPMDVRHYLAPWIENQAWERAEWDRSRAVELFQVLLENMDNQFSRFDQHTERFLMQRNFRRFKQNFQKYQDEPHILAGIFRWFLTKEKEILDEAEIADQVQQLQVESMSVELDHQRQIERRTTDLKSRVQVMQQTLKCLEEQQDEFDFKYQTHKMEVIIDENERRRQVTGLQKMLNMLDMARRGFLSSMTSLLDEAEALLAVLVKEELVAWQRRQQISCIGAPEDTSLDLLEKWFTLAVEVLFQVHLFLQKLEELLCKVTYDKDPFKAQKPTMEHRVNMLLNTLLQSAFVVETQPSMPLGRGPLVLRTNVQFSVKVRLLVKLPELNHAMKVTVSMDKEFPQLKGYRRFNICGTKSKALNMAESMSGGMVADFRHLILKDQKSGGGGKCVSEVSLSVTEELHIINFETQFELFGKSITLEASSLPVVVISNSSQQQSAWASVLWFNMLCSDPKDVLFLASSPVARWPQLGEMLSWQFLASAQRGLDEDQLNTLAHKLFGNQMSYDNCTISWARFSKENMERMDFTLWLWLDGILDLVKKALADLWRDGCIMGFVSRPKEKVLLKRKRHGTFLLRFSESSRDGGITFSWVEHTAKGTPTIRTVKPFSKSDLAQLQFHEILRNFKILETEGVPIEPLLYLYPDTPKEQVIGKYKSESSGEENPRMKYLKTKLMFVLEKKGCTSGAEGEQHSGEASDPPLPSEMDDVMLSGFGNSPMLPSPSSEVFMPAEDICAFGDDFSEAGSDSSSFYAQDSNPEHPNILSGLQEFLIDPNLLAGVNLNDFNLHFMPCSLPLTP